MPRLEAIRRRGRRRQSGLQAAHQWLHRVSVQPEFPLSPRQYSSANASQVRGTCWPGVHEP
eukprot:scaffold3067_cov67-Phaeocystis_antarctica.AAC.7